MVFFCFWRVGGGIETEEEGLGKATVVKGFLLSVGRGGRWEKKKRISNILVQLKSHMPSFPTV